jgi:hypothetical protein
MSWDLHYVAEDPTPWVRCESPHFQFLKELKTWLDTHEHPRYTRIKIMDFKDDKGIKFKYHPIESLDRMLKLGEL